MQSQSPPVSHGKIRAHVWVSGKVQGVGYRAYTCDAAKRLGVEGWVRNLDNGQVEAVFEGTEAAVTAMVQWCHQGSPAAIVQQVMVEYESPEGLQGFRALR